MGAGASDHDAAPQALPLVPIGILAICVAWAVFEAAWGILGLIEVLLGVVDEDISALAVAGGDAARPVMLSLPVRLLYIAAVALVLADVDWAAKAWALDQLRPDQLVLNTDRPWHAVMTRPVLAVILVACARTRLLALGAGVIIGGALGNMGEFAVFGRVTDFIPLGVPYRGSTWSPADFFLMTGLVLLWAGAAQYPRASALQARDPLHGRRRRPRRQGDALPGDS